jgi:hypothetical protein
VLYDCDDELDIKPFVNVKYWLEDVSTTTDDDVNTEHAIGDEFVLILEQLIDPAFIELVLVYKGAPRYTPVLDVANAVAEMYPRLVTLQPE